MNYASFNALCNLVHLMYEKRTASIKFLIINHTAPYGPKKCSRQNSANIYQQLNICTYKIGTLLFCMECVENSRFFLGFTHQSVLPFGS